MTGDTSNRTDMNDIQPDLPPLDQNKIERIDTHLEATADSLLAELAKHPEKTERVRADEEIREAIKKVR